MVILTKKRLGFVKQDGNARIESERFISKGGMAIEDAPEWIEKDPLFTLAVASGELVTVNGKTPKAEAEAVAKAKEAEKKAAKAEGEAEK